MHGGDIYSNQILLDFSVNINPLGANDEIKFALIDAISSGKLENYPDLKCTELSNRLSAHFSIPPENLIFSNGASELISAFLRAVCADSSAHEKILLLTPCFSGYLHVASSVGMQTIDFPLSAQNDFCFDRATAAFYIDFANRQNIQLGIITNPNNPNGALIAPEILLQIAEEFQKTGKKLLIDECFMELTKKSKDFSLIPLLSKMENVTILRSFTKSFGIPGVRLGYGIFGDKTLAAKTQNQLPEWNVSVLAQIAGLAVLSKNSQNYLEISRKLIEKERNFISSGLKSLGFTVFSSESCFVLFEIPNWLGNLYEKLLKKRILIRHCTDYNGLGENFYRIAVKKHRENEILLAQLSELVKTEGK